MHTISPIDFDPHAIATEVTRIAPSMGACDGTNLLRRSRPALAAWGREDTSIPALPRTITPHEAARLQTFPDYFDFGACERRTALSRIIGNAVPPRVSAVLLAIMLKAGVFDR